MPTSGMVIRKAFAVMVTPLASVPCQVPDIRMISAVAVQMISVSIIGPTIATRPSLTGSRVRAAPCAMDSVPIPASLENAPRRTPVAITVPIAPPAAAVPLNASVMINER